jgi:AcrR family transcriptional regulator
MNPRPYRSSRRAKTAAQTRERIVTAAAAMLGAPEGAGGFSLDAVARKAGVTRLTVYNQFGSRRALLEAVFDETATRGGLHRIAEAMTNPDPHAGLRRIVAIFCDFWSYDSAALWRLHAAGASDPELEASLRARNERRRRLLSVTVARMAEGGRMDSQVLVDLVDMLFALTSFSFFSELTAGGRTADAACRLIQELANDVIRRAMPGSKLT